MTLCAAPTRRHTRITATRIARKRRSPTKGDARLCPGVVLRSLRKGIGMARAKKIRSCGRLPLPGCMVSLGIKLVLLLLALPRLAPFVKTKTQQYELLHCVQNISSVKKKEHVDLGRLHLHTTRSISLPCLSKVCIVAFYGCLFACSCTKNETVQCIVDPCADRSCPAHPSARCLANYCNKTTFGTRTVGPCKAVYVDMEGEAVICSVEDVDCVCTGQYEPVCGTNNQTYSNRCEAECDGQTIVYIGRCASLPRCVCGVPRQRY